MDTAKPITEAELRRSILDIIADVEQIEARGDLIALASVGSIRNVSPTTTPLMEFAARVARESKDAS